MRGALLSLTLLATAAAGAPAQAREPRSPVVVELYTAQGCDECSEADALMGALSRRKGVLPLTFSVDYWDYMGWKDTFAAPEFGERQHAYTERLKVRDVYTPEVVVNGRAEAPGVDAEKVEALIRKAPLMRGAGRPPRIALGRRSVRVGPGEDAGEVWLVRYDPKPKLVRVRGDDHKTRTVTLFNVVRELVRLGAWRGRARTYGLPPPKGDGLNDAVLVQGKAGGRIIAAAHG